MVVIRSYRVRRGQHRARNGAVTMPDGSLEGEHVVKAACNPLVGLSGFPPLTADVLALALSRHGLQ